MTSHHLIQVQFFQVQASFKLRKLETAHFANQLGFFLLKMVNMTSSWEAVELFFYPRSSKVVIAIRAPNSSAAGVSCRRLDHCLCYLPGWCWSSALEHRYKATSPVAGSAAPASLSPAFLWQESHSHVTHGRLSGGHWEASLADFSF